MILRHTFLAALAVAALQTSSVYGIDATWSGGDGNFTDANWVDGDGNPVTPAATDNIIIPTGTVTVDSDLAGAVGDFAELRVAAGTVDVTTGGRLSFAGNILLGTEADQTATLIMQGDSVFSGASFRWASAAGSNADVIMRDTASFSTIGTQDIIGFSSALGAGTWTTEGSTVTIQSDDDIWIGDDDVWIANIDDANDFSTANADDAYGFVGNGAVQVNLSGFQQELGQRWRLIESHGETTQGPIANGAVPATFTVTGLEPGFGMRIIGEEVSDTLGYLDVEMLNVLNLKVDTTTGEAVLENPAAGGLPLDVDGYTITSASGSLNEAGFNGLADDGEAGWVAGQSPSQGSSRLSEANFDASTTIDGSSSFGIGDIFGGTQDLAIQFTMTNGLTLGGTVEYVGGPVPADLNQDGYVDGLDLGILLGNFDQVADPSGGELNGTDPVDGLDLGILLGAWAPPTQNGGLAAVPEPTSLALIGLALTIAPLARRRHRC